MLSMLYHLQALSGPGSLTKNVMRGILNKLKTEFLNEKVRCGVLVEGPPGQHACSNPSERRTGFDRSDKLLDDWEKWEACSKSLAAILDQEGEVEIVALLSELQKAEMTAYSGSPKQYSSVRFVRMLLHCSNAKFADSEADWNCLRGMSKHVSDVVKANGIQRFDDAEAMRKSMSAVLSKQRGGYSFSDLVIFLCLIRFKDKKNNKQEAQGFAWK